MANHAMEIGIVTLLGLMILLGANWLSDRRVSPDLSRRVAGALGGLVLLVACLGVAFLYQPYWIAAAGALAAVIAERFRPTTHPIWDDNWTIVAAALTVMIALRR